MKIQQMEQQMKLDVKTKSANDSDIGSCEHFFIFFCYFSVHFFFFKFLFVFLASKKGRTRKEIVNEIEKVRCTIIVKNYTARGRTN